MINIIQNWWLAILRGVIAIVFGVVAFLWPGSTLFALVLLFGFYALADGLIAVAAGLTHTKDSPRWWVFLLEGLVGIAAGVATLVWPGVTTLVLIAMIAAWAILTGILEIAAAIRLRRAVTNEWRLAAGGLLSVALGVALILQPLTGSLVIIWIVGAYALIFGVMWILLGLRLRGLDRMFKPHHSYIHRKGSHVSRF
jgi:uncharacterized membrane protein HdeD (DUF308 family)